MSPTIDDETKAAGVEWIDWYYMQKLLNEDAAVADATILLSSAPLDDTGALQGDATAWLRIDDEAAADAATNTTPTTEGSAPRG